MIHEVDASLREVLRDAVDNDDVEISFEAPTREWATRRNAPVLNAYLYDVREDVRRRLVQYRPVVDDEGRVVDRRLPPRLFKLSYLLTAWTQRPEDEHRLLAATLGKLIQAEVIPHRHLQGSLAHLDEGIHLTVAQPLTQDRSISDVWTALGGELKASLDLVVVAPFDTTRTLYTGPPVTEEPRIVVAQPDGEAEERRGRRGEAAQPEEEELPEEQFFGGKQDGGRQFTIRTLPRR